MLTMNGRISMTPGTCTIVIPTYNEEANIVNMAVALREMYPDFHVAFMDDNSTDRSKQLIEELGDPKVRLVTRKPEERGLAASVLQGILESDTDYFINMDCDFQHPITAVRQIYDELEKGADLCIGIREDRFALGFIRWVGSWTFNMVADVYLFAKRKKCSKDVMSGLFGGRCDIFQKVVSDNWEGFEMQGWKVLLDLLKYGPRDIKIANISYKFGKREAGESHLSPKVVVTTLHQCGRVGRFFSKVYSNLRGCD